MITISCIPHEKQRYPTTGDWLFTRAGDLTISVSDTGVQHYNFLLALHEMIEAYLCKAAGISGSVVDNWDLAHLDSKNPGGLPGCPYAKQHEIAELIEYLVAKKLDVDWKTYEEALEKLCK